MALAADDGRGMTAKSPGEVSSNLSRGFPNGATHLVKSQVLYLEWIPGELKHLSTLRKRNRLRFPE